MPRQSSSSSLAADSEQPAEQPQQQVDPSAGQSSDSSSNSNSSSNPLSAAVAAVEQVIVKRIFQARDFCHELGLRIPLGHIDVAELLDGTFRIATPHDVVPQPPAPPDDEAPASASESAAAAPSQPAQ